MSVCLCVRVCVCLCTFHGLNCVPGDCGDLNVYLPANVREVQWLGGGGMDVPVGFDEFKCNQFQPEINIVVVLKIPRTFRLNRPGT